MNVLKMTEVISVGLTKRCGVKCDFGSFINAQRSITFTKAEKCSYYPSRE